MAKFDAWMDPSEAVLAELQSKYDRVYRTETDAGPVYYRPLNRMEYRRILARLRGTNPDAGVVSQEEMVTICVVYPSKDVMAAELEASPAISSTISDAILLTAKGSREGLQKK